MLSKLKIAIILIFVFAASPVWAAMCDNTENIKDLVSCVETSTEKNSTHPTDFTQWVKVENKCTYELIGLMKLSNDTSDSGTLHSGTVLERNLPTGVEVTSFHCCSPPDFAECRIPE